MGALALAVIGFYFIRFILHSHRSMKELQRKHFKRNATVVEEERRKIADDMHDGFSSKLLVLQNLIHPLRGANADEKQVLNKAVDWLDDLMSQASELVNELSVKMVEKRGIIGALDYLAESVSLGAAIQCTFEWDCKTTPDLETATQVYRIVQEIVQNTLKHAAASHLNIFLYTTDSQLLLRTEDDGKGFVVHSQAKDAGLGLRSLHSRADMLGGSVNLVTGPGAGTKYYITIPLNSQS